MCIRDRCYYGTDAAGSESFFANKHTDFSEGKRFIIIHMAASYANGRSDAFYGTNATGEALAQELYNYCVNKPEIPDVAKMCIRDRYHCYGKPENLYRLCIRRNSGGHGRQRQYRGRRQPGAEAVLHARQL